MPDIPAIHNVLGYFLTAWFAFNGGIVAGGWWATKGAHE